MKGNQDHFWEVYRPGGLAFRRTWHSLMVKGPITKHWRRYQSRQMHSIWTDFSWAMEHWREK